MYLTFEAIESGTFKFSGTTSAHTLSYSLDDGTTWTTLAHNTDTPTISAGSKIMWKGNLTPQSYEGIGRFVATGRFDVYGNIMSLLYGDDFVGQTSLTGKAFAFEYLFRYNSKVVSAQNLILPTTTLAEYCYDSMFEGCTSLTTAPALPATTLARFCYYYMFHNCTSLTTAPELPATTLAEYCYQFMFEGCTSLTIAPELPATKMASRCYGYMFHNCTNINYIKMLATDISASNALTNWVNGVSSTGTFVKAAGVTIPTGDSGIPSDWTVVEA